MNRTSTVLGLTLTLASLAASGPLKVTTYVSPGPYFAGQAIEMRVEVDPGTGSTVVETPRLKDAEVYPMPPDPAMPSVHRFVVVPGRAGALDLPASRARSGDRSGASRSMKLAVSSHPPEGRTSAFLGGVGPFEVRAESDLSSVRVGQTLEYRVSISGPAAYGSVRSPDSNGWKSPTLDVEPLADRLQVTPSPVRTFRYRLRPLKAGPLKLPPVAVAAFDPIHRRYATRATSSLTIRVEESPRFDPNLLDYPPTPRRSRTVPVVLAIGASVASGLAVAAWSVARRRQRSPATHPRNLALELANGLEAVDDETEAARLVAGALTTFLHRVAGRPPGVLTPPEARIGFARLTDDPGLARLAETLVTRCDRARYGAGGIEAGALVEEGRRFFEGLAEVAGKGGRPGEAVETAR